MKVISLSLVLSLIVGVSDAFVPASRGVIARPLMTSTLLLASPKKQLDTIEDWENDTYEIDEPIPTTMERFLKAKYPEFYFLLSKNENVLQNVVRRQQQDDDGEESMGTTFFVPNAQVFAKLGEKRRLQLRDERNLEMVEKLVTYHVVNTEALPFTRIFTEDWTRGRPKDGSPPAFTVQGIQTMGGIVPVGRSKSGGFLGLGAKEDGKDAVIGTNNAKIVQSFFVGKDKNCIVHEMDGLVSPELLWRYADQLRIPGF